MAKKTMSIAWCTVVVIGSIGQPAVAAAPARTVAMQPSASNGQASDAPKTATEFAKYLQTLTGQLTSWKQQIDSIPFDSLNVGSAERGHLDGQRSLCFHQIAALQKDIENIRSQHSLSDGIWLLSDVYDLKEDVDTLDSYLTNLYSARDAGSEELGAGLAKQNRSLETQIDEAIETILPYLLQKAAKTAV